MNTLVIHYKGQDLIRFATDCSSIDNAISSLRIANFGNAGQLVWFYLYSGNGRVIDSVSRILN